MLTRHQNRYSIRHIESLDAGNISSPALAAFEACAYEESFFFNAGPKGAE